jgi:hypothetical protein
VLLAGFILTFPANVMRVAVQAALAELLLHHARYNFALLGDVQRHRWTYGQDSRDVSCFDHSVRRPVAYCGCWWTKMDMMGQPVGHRNHNSYVYFWDSRAHPHLRGFNLMNPVRDQAELSSLLCQDWKCVCRRSGEQQCVCGELPAHWVVELRRLCGPSAEPQVFPDAAITVH